MSSNSDMVAKKEIYVDWDGWVPFDMPAFLRRERVVLFGAAYRVIPTVQPAGPHIPPDTSHKPIGAEGLEDVL